MLLTLQYSTQWDSLAHVGQTFDVDGNGVPRDVYHNGFRAGVDIAGPGDGEPVGARRLGVENMAAACVQGRAVMIDLEAHFGATRRLVGYDELMRVLGRDRVAVEAGDFVCLRTGFAQRLLEMGERPDA